MVFENSNESTPTLTHSQLPVNDLELLIRLSRKVIDVRLTRECFRLYFAKHSRDSEPPVIEYLGSGYSQ